VTQGNTGKWPGSTDIRFTADAERFALARFASGLCDDDEDDHLSVPVALRDRRRYGRIGTIWGEHWGFAVPLPRCPARSFYFSRDVGLPSLRHRQL